MVKIDQYKNDYSIDDLANIPVLNIPEIPGMINEMYREFAQKEEDLIVDVISKAKGSLATIEDAKFCQKLYHVDFDDRYIITYKGNNLGLVVREFGNSNTFHHFINDYTVRADHTVTFNVAFYPEQSFTP